MKVALVHDWLLGMRGEEKVLEALCEMFPDAKVHTLFYDPARVSSSLRERVIRACAERFDRAAFLGRFSEFVRGALRDPAAAAELKAAASAAPSA